MPKFIAKATNLKVYVDPRRGKDEEELRVQFIAGQLDTDAERINGIAYTKEERERIEVAIRRDPFFGVDVVEVSEGDQQVVDEQKQLVEENAALKARLAELEGKAEPEPAEPEKPKPPPAKKKAPAKKAEPEELK